MRNIWAKIGLGILGVFVAGMLLVSVGREVKLAVAQAVRTSVADHTDALRVSAGKIGKEFPFRLDGERLGTVTRLDLRRGARGTPLSAQIGIRLEDGDAARRVAECDLVPQGSDDVGLDDGFRCAEPGEEGLTRVGTMRFDPAEISRPLMVDQDQLDQLSHGDPLNLSMDLTAGLNLKGESNHSRFDLSADSGGAVIRVDGADGEPLVRLLADSSGAFIRIHDKNGRELFRLLAGQHGVSIRGQKTGRN